MKESSGRTARRLGNLTDKERLKELGLFDLQTGTLKEKPNHSPLVSER